MVMVPLKATNNCHEGIANRDNHDMIGHHGVGRASLSSHDNHAVVRSHDEASPFPSPSPSPSPSPPEDGTAAIVNPNSVTFVAASTGDDMELIADNDHVISLKEMADSHEESPPSLEKISCVLQTHIVGLKQRCDAVEMVLHDAAITMSSSDTTAPNENGSTTR